MSSNWFLISKNAPIMSRFELSGFSQKLSGTDLALLNLQVDVLGPVFFGNGNIGDCVRHCPADAATQALDNSRDDKLRHTAGLHGK